MEQRRIPILILITYLLSAISVPVYSSTDQKVASPHPSMQSHADHHPAPEPELTQADSCCSDSTDKYATKPLTTKLCEAKCQCPVNGCMETQPLNTIEIHSYPATLISTVFALENSLVPRLFLQLPERVPIV